MPDWITYKGQEPWVFIKQGDKYGYINNPNWTPTPESPISLVAKEPQLWGVIHTDVWGYLNNPRWKDQK